MQASAVVYEEVAWGLRRCNFNVFLCEERHVSPLLALVAGDPDLLRHMADVHAGVCREATLRGLRVRASTLT